MRRYNQLGEVSINIDGAWVFHRDHQAEVKRLTDEIVAMKDADYQYQCLLGTVPSLSRSAMLDDAIKENIFAVDAGRSDGSSADYYVLPASARELQDLISHKNMNAQIGEIFRSCYRFGEASHSNQLRDAKKIKFYIDAEVSRLEGLEADGEVSKAK
tara:strand:- start:11 stop:481 length:471 start_codon:yes stop_codon:yes gene_type:complete